MISRIIPELGTGLLKESGFDVTGWHKDRPMTRKELLAGSKNQNVLLITGTEKIDREFLNACTDLKLISLFSVGYDNVDIPEATRLGIIVTNTPDALTEATADIAFGLMLAVARKMFFLHKSIIAGGWDYFRPTAHLGLDLQNKTLGIFGLGRIGKAMARKCQGAYGMRIIYCDLMQDAEAEKNLNATYVDFETLLQESDIFTVHCPLTNETKGIFNRSAFEVMKPTAIFINTARGQIHNEKDLIQALETKKIWGAGLDVTDPEPMQSGSSLLTMENVAVLPHIGSATVEARNEMARLAASNIIEYYKNRKVPHIVNPEVLKD